MLLPLAGFCQTGEATIFDEATIVYNNSIFGGPILHTNGWGGELSFGKSKTAFKYRILQFEMVGMKHPKEIKSYNTIENNRSYIFGKVNSFFILRPSYGMRVISFDKIRKSGVSVGYSWRVGPSIGFTKPVYLQIGIPEPYRYARIIVEKYDPDKHQSQDIVGRAGVLRGIDELRIHPGLYGAFAINFEYAADREGIKGIEVGATIDYYPVDRSDFHPSTKLLNSLFASSTL